MTLGEGITALVKRAWPSTILTIVNNDVLIYNCQGGKIELSSDRWMLQSAPNLRQGQTPAVAAMHLKEGEITKLIKLGHPYSWRGACNCTRVHSSFVTVTTPHGVRSETPSSRGNTLNRCEGRAATSIVYDSLRAASRL